MAKQVKVKTPWLSFVHTCIRNPYIRTIKGWCFCGRNGVMQWLLCEAVPKEYFDIPDEAKQIRFRIVSRACKDSIRICAIQDCAILAVQTLDGEGEAYHGMTTELCDFLRRHKLSDKRINVVCEWR
jgi:hypothetical protein